MSLNQDRNVDQLMQTPLLKELPGDLQHKLFEFAQRQYSVLGANQPRVIGTKAELFIAYGALAANIGFHKLHDDIVGSLMVMFIRPIMRTHLEYFDSLSADTDEVEAVEG